MVYIFARVNAVIGMKVKDYFIQSRERPLQTAAPAAQRAVGSSMRVSNSPRNSGSAK
jgi:hypothetical protein